LSELPAYRALGAALKPVDVILRPAGQGGVVAVAVAPTGTGAEAETSVRIGPLRLTQ
jgi:hypothetical protein